MNGLTARWTFRQSPAHEGPKQPLINRILSVRGFSNPAEAAAFLSPKLTQLHDPSLIPDLDRAAERIVRAMRDGERIVIYGDYDVDGITATAILFHTIRMIEPNADVRTYVPHRLDEGYGLNSAAIAEIAAAGAKVIVSVDCGITAVEPANEAARLGVDLIITDHHTPPTTMEGLPRAFAVVHPRRPDSAYPFGELSGAGVAYKLAWRLATAATGSSRADEKVRGMLVELLAMAALGTIADIVPLVGENRVLASFGLVRAKHSPLIGLQALVDASGLGGEDIGAMEVGFRLGPRLNAAGRMGHSREAVELFTVADAARCKEIAEHLSKQNEQRRRVESDIFELACELAEKQGMTGTDRRAIVLAHETWHAGVVGIVCSRLVERFHRPAILMQKRDGVCHGSGRSVDGFNLHAGLTHCAEHLEKYGGHSMAAGVHVVEPKLSHFVDAFTEYANAAIAPERLCAGVTIDCEATMSELSLEGVNDLQRLGPFGAGNPRPKVLVRNLRITEFRAMGSMGKHLSIRLRSGDAVSNGGVSEWRAVGWNWGRHASRLAVGKSVDAVISPAISYFGGGPRVEPEIADLAIRA
ncbi:MAG: single-stranded-DNA-specific exonuclease RecJ [Phycisphaerales bacterium]|nr:single-stranded-DNA-specific exonuclease RecJ [Phycisphaerales bacterium]